MAAPLINKLDTLLSLVEGSRGARSWRHLYIRTDTGDQDILQHGDLSCAYFASSLLLIMGLVKEPHATVTGCLKDMAESGWTKIDKPRPGAVLVWEPQATKDEAHRHIGFFIADRNAVSNSTWRRWPVQHHWTYHGRRRVESIWWHKDLDGSSATIAE